MSEDGEKAYEGMTVFSASYVRCKLLSFRTIERFLRKNRKRTPLSEIKAKITPTTIPAMAEPLSPDEIGDSDGVADAVPEKK
jgi:hypothetical protein